MISYSQAGQDLFVLQTLKNKKNGIYVEIGGHLPIHINNTYLLETEYNWSGLSLELDDSCIQKYNEVRKNLCIKADATKFNYEEYFIKNNFPITIDYLSLDIEPVDQTFAALCKLPLDKYRFSVITFEHEFYSAGPKYRDYARILLKNLGYNLFKADVDDNGLIFEDWYIDSRLKL